MENNLLLSRNEEYSSEFIDCSVGEPYLVQDILTKVFSLQTLIVEPALFRYQHPAGYKPLVHFLEKKHNKKVIIGNGATQCLGAALHALKAKKFRKIKYRIPYWFFVPELVSNVGLRSEFDLSQNLNFNGNFDSFLLVAPNNPDSFLPSIDEIKEFEKKCKKENIPLIHDGAYYSNIYLNDNSDPQPIGDIQIFSASKSHGISGVRIGYAVLHNEEYYNDMVDYIEKTSVGVSTLSQSFFLSILKKSEEVPEIKNIFEKSCRDQLFNNKLILKNCKLFPEQELKNLENSSGIFAWLTPNKNIDYKKIQVKVSEGIMFGDSSKIRINLCLEKEKLEELVCRFNSI